MVVSIDAMPPREKSASIVSLPVVDTKPVARRIDGLDPGDEIALLRFVDERHDERRLREQGEDPANTAQPKMARNGGTWRTLRTTRSTSGSRLSSETW